MCQTLQRAATVLGILAAAAMAWFALADRTVSLTDFAARIDARSVALAAQLGSRSADGPGEALAREKRWAVAVSLGARISVIGVAEFESGSEKYGAWIKFSLSDSLPADGQ